MQFACKECGVTSQVSVYDRGDFIACIPEYCPYCGHSVVPAPGEVAVVEFKPPEVEPDNPLDHPSLSAGERNDLGGLNAR